jgi:cephalosporin hydroxylase
MTRDWHGESVFVATPVRPEVAANFHTSILAMCYHDLSNHGLIARGGAPVAWPATPMNLPQIRNHLTVAMLDSTQADWLLWVDADAGFDPDICDRLVEAADPIERPVVGALAFMVAKREPDGMGGWRWTPAPTLYDWGGPDGKPGFFHRYEYPDNTVLRVAATGCHMLLVHRSVLEKLRAEHGDTWFDRVLLYEDQGTLGEDFSFCARLARAQVPIHVHTGVKTSHQQTIWLSEENYQGALMLSRMTDAAKAEASAEVPEGVQVYFPVPAASGADVLPVPLKVDIGASVESLRREDHVRPDGMLKMADDLDRYAHIIAVTKPEVIVETGSYQGKSARWFLDTMHAADPARMHEVISIDVEQRNESWTYTDRGCVTFVGGDSASHSLAHEVGQMVRGRRCMVVLDSDHSAAHVAREIELYGPLVSEGCYLVVEDTVFGYAPPELAAQHLPGQIGTPLDAVQQLLVDSPDWERAEDVEALHPVTHHPAGWWVRRG